MQVKHTIGVLFGDKRNANKHHLVKLIECAIVIRIETNRKVVKKYGNNRIFVKGYSLRYVSYIY